MNRLGNQNLKASNPTMDLDGLDGGIYYQGPIWVGSNRQKIDVVWDTGSAVTLPFLTILYSGYTCREHLILVMDVMTHWDSIKQQALHTKD